jgi:hypothetical protein
VVLKKLILPKMMFLYFWFKASLIENKISVEVRVSYIYRLIRELIEWEREFEHILRRYSLATQKLVLGGHDSEQSH